MRKKSDYSYLDNIGNSFSNARLHLYRTFSANKWNTIVLPVGLSKEQFATAFGDDATLAELSDVTSSRIVFKTVGEESASDDGTNYLLQPMTPYIIKTSKANGEKSLMDDWDESSYEEPSVTYIDTDGAKKEIGISNLVSEERFEDNYNGDESALNYFLIDNVKLSSTLWAGTHWNFSGLNVEDEGNYVVEGKSVGDIEKDGTVTPYGTLAANYKLVYPDTNGGDEENEEEDSGNDATTTPSIEQVETNASMHDAYVLTTNSEGKNVMAYLGKNGAKTKGLRCYFRYASPTPGDQNAKMNFAVDINGIVDDTTVIEDIMDDSTTVGKCTNGVYTLGGQCVRKNTASTQGLPKGVYIVNGKKMVKK